MTYVGNEVRSILPSIQCLVCSFVYLRLSWMVSRSPQNEREHLTAWGVGDKPNKKDSRFLHHILYRKQSKKELGRHRLFDHCSCSRHGKRGASMACYQ